MAAVDNQRALGNFGAKPRVKHGDKEYVFDWPGAKVVSDMERVCKKAAMDILLESKEYLTPADYAEEAKKYKTQLETGYFRGPNGPGYQAYYAPEGGSVEAFVSTCMCLLAPNHPDITRAEVLDLIQNHMDEIRIIVSEQLRGSMPDAPKETPDPKAASVESVLQHG